MPYDEPEDDVEYRIISFGWRDRIPHLPRPVWALPGRTLWKVVVHGRGFEIPSASGNAALIGFYTTYFVSARSARDASVAAIEKTRARWVRSAPGSLAHGALVVEVQDLQPTLKRFRWQSGEGYSFYSSDVTA